MTKKQAKAALFICAKYLLFFGAVFVLFFAKIDASISPFAPAFLFACIFLPLDISLCAILTFACSLFVNASHTETLSMLCIVGVFFVFSRIIKAVTRRHKKIKALPLVVIAYLIANAYAVIDSASSGANEDLYKMLISVMIGCVFLVCVVVLINTVRTKRARIPWTIDQKICAAVFATVFALGLTGLNSDTFSVHKFITIFIILTGVYLFDARNTLVIAVCLGLGQSLAALNLNYVAIYAMLCAAAMAFKSRNRAYSIVALFFTDIVLGTYFDAYVNYDFYALLPIFAAIALFLVFPRGIVAHFDFSMNSMNGHLVSKNTINRNRAGIHAKLNNLARVFGEMQHIYKGLVQPHIPPEENKTLLASQILQSVCEGCQHNRHCNQTAAGAEDMRHSFESLSYAGLTRGSVNFLDLPAAITVNCNRVNSIIGTTNSLLKQNQERTQSSATLDAGKMLMAQLLGGLNRLMLRFAHDACAGVVFDNERAELIKEELLYKNIVVSDCLITKNNMNEYSVSILIPRADTSNSAIESIISRVVRHKVQIDSIDDSDTAGFAIVTAKTAPRYSVKFGVAQVSKSFNQQSGDVFSFLKISNDRTMMAICDGMGTGERANRSSVLALSLVENFYKVGLPSDMIMTSVNQLLTITGQDIFSALDIAVFNLNSGETDFVKVGASDGFIKRTDEVEIIEAGSLPIGILEEMQPKMTRAVLSQKDFVVLASDGVSDAFGERVILANFINNLTVKSPQDLADQVMQECLNRSGRVAADDCTVIVAQFQER